ncbi:MAG: hypothetical protein KZQ66_07775, partial [Candidatus Thiodiazotropha sp. (ex Lucinoma aequizonata)]|nr:hypothetical protein [Candidatus Thiodiazotropha sp. (ex Lucinoma aequizonata)]
MGIKAADVCFDSWVLRREKYLALRFLLRQKAAADKPLIACSVTNTCQSWLLRLAIYFPLSKEKRNYSAKKLEKVLD